MSSQFINAHLPPGRVTKPVPVLTDRMLDLSPESVTDCDALAAHANPTLFPDRFFFSLTPIIIMRHPALAIPSYVRAHRRLGPLAPENFLPNLTMAGSFVWERLIFDSYKSFEESVAKAEGRVAKIPIVMDGGKLVKDPHSQLRKLCEAVGLDDTQIKLSWDNPRVKEGTTIADTFHSAFNASTGITPDSRYDRPLDLEEEIQGWAKEWDESTADAVAETVKLAMNDYEYLLRFSL